MKKTLAILVATTALSALLGIPAWSAMSSGVKAPDTVTLQAEDEQTLLRLIEDDGEDDDTPRVQRSKHDDDGEDEDEDDDEDGCEGGKSACGGANNPAPAGTAPPPSNGLFGNGTAPKVQVN